MHLNEGQLFAFLIAPVHSDTNNKFIFPLNTKKKHICFYWDFLDDADKGINRNNVDPAIYFLF